MNANEHGEDLCLIRLPQLLEILGTSRSWLYSAIKRGSFPPPIKLGDQGSDRIVAWRRSDIHAWIKSRRRV